MSQIKPHIAFIGVGNMGNPMAANLIKAGYSLTVFDLIKDKTNNLVKLGAHLASDMAQAVREANVVMTSCQAQFRYKK